MPAMMRSRLAAATLVLPITASSLLLGGGCQSPSRTSEGPDYSRQNRWQYAPMSTLFCMNWEDTDALPLDRAKLGLPISAVFPYQGLFMGDPLSAPYAREPVVTVAGVERGETISGVVTMRSPHR